MPSTYERSLVKGIVWEIFSFVITLLAVFAFYGNIILSLKFALVLTLIKMFFFFIHERIWKKITWGKIRDAGEKSLKNNSFPSQ